MPADGYEFAYWEGDVSSMQNPITVMADVAKSVKAVFTPLTPEFISVSNATNGVTLVWTNLAWATEYNIYRAPSSTRTGGPLATLVADGTHSYFDATGDVGVPYWYWVEAVGAVDANECVNPVSGKKLKPIVISNITYENLRGTTHTNPATYQEETEVAFTPPSGTVTGYTFAGWTPNVITAEMTGDQTVTANWTANSYEVQFHANGGSGTMANQAMTYDEEGTLPSNAFVRAGYVFVGWAAREDTSSTNWADGAVVSNLTAEAGGVTELWAVWAECVVATPTIAPADGSSFGTATCTVTLACETEGATIYYRTGGGSPKATAKFLYDGPFTIDNTTTIKAFAIKENWTQSALLEATLTKIDMSLEAALGLDDGVTVTTGGNEPWMTVLDDTAKDGDKSAQSGAIGDSEESWIQLSVSGAGILTFWTKVSCEEDDPGCYEFDHLLIEVDGVENEDFRMDGESEWVQRAVTFTTTGTHALKVVYQKDDGLDEGDDCAWLDGVVWTPSAAPADPIPDLGDEPTVEEITNVLNKAEDPKLAVKITNEAAYTNFSAWAKKVQPHGGGDAIGAAGVMAAQRSRKVECLRRMSILRSARPKTEKSSSRLDLTRRTQRQRPSS